MIRGRQQDEKGLMAVDVSSRLYGVLWLADEKDLRTFEAVIIG